MSPYSFHVDRTARDLSRPVSWPHPPCTPHGIILTVWTPVVTCSSPKHSLSPSHLRRATPHWSCPSPTVTTSHHLLAVSYPFPRRSPLPPHATQQECLDLISKRRQDLRRGRPTKPTGSPAGGRGGADAASSPRVRNGAAGAPSGRTYQNLSSRPSRGSRGSVPAPVPPGYVPYVSDGSGVHTLYIHATPSLPL